MQWFNQSASNGKSKIEYLVAYLKANDRITEIRYYEKSSFGRFRIEWEDYYVHGSKEFVVDKAVELMKCDYAYYPLFVRRLNAVRFGYVPMGYAGVKTEFNKMPHYFRIDIETKEN